MANIVKTKETEEDSSRFSVAMTTPGYQKLVSRTLGDPERCKRFITAVSSAVANNKELQDCNAGSILCGALQGEALNLSPSPQLGQYYLVPFMSKGDKKAQFILGYKGYIQLAIRSGQYKKLNVVEIKQGELVKYDALNEVIEVNLIDDFEEREKAETIGYYAMFEYLNGFRKVLYWSKEKMLSHADSFSASFSKKAYDDYINGRVPENMKWKYSSNWYKDFDGMAKKTMLRQLISKWGIMSLEMQKAFETDQSVLNFDDNGKIINSSDFEDVEYQTAPEGTTDKVEVQAEATGIVQKASLEDF